MGESAYLMRSFSHPSNASREAKEGDPIRALTESISFGRFMSESLAWEKWSTFSHNRYLEEVEQFSKPGSVAQKKAYFEAHYKKRAAMKAAALLEQASTTANSIPEEETADKSHNNSPVESDFEKATSNVIVVEQQEKGVLDTVLAHSADANEFYANGQGDNLQNVKMERSEEMVEQNVEVENLIQVENSMQLEKAEDSDITLATPERKMPNSEAAEKENMTLPSNKRHMNSSSTSSSRSRAPKLSKSSAKQASPTQLKPGTNVAPNSKKSAGDLMDKKRLTAKSLHMSINFASRLGETSKISAKVSKECSSTPPNPTRASVYGVSKLLPSMVRQSEDKRTKSLLNKSVSGGTMPGGILQALSGDCSKSLRTSGSKVRPPIISSPFSFRSEERAAKRKEFFQKLEEKNNVKEAEKIHLQGRFKEKGEHDLRKLLQSTGYRAKPSEDLYHGSQSPSNPVKKIPLTRPRSPKLGRKPIPIVGQETSFRLPKRSSLNAQSSKRVVQKSNQSIARSFSLLPKKKAHENASPNIQR